MQMEKPQQLDSQNTFEGRERMEKEQLLIADRINNGDYSRQSEYYWDSKSNELWRLQHQAC